MAKIFVPANALRMLPQPGDEYDLSVAPKIAIPPSTCWNCGKMITLRCMQFNGTVHLPVTWADFGLLRRTSPEEKKFFGEIIVFPQALRTEILRAWVFVLEEKQMNFKDAITELFRNHDSYSRLPRLLEMQQNGELRPKTFYRLLGEIWDSCDNVGPCGWELGEIIDETMWAHTTPGTLHIPAMMTRKEQKALAALPEKVEVYRGCGPRNKDGCSWTLDRAVAERFPRYMRFFQEEPLLLTAVIERNMISALKLDRKEKEIVLFILPNDGDIREEAIPVAA